MPPEPWTEAELAAHRELQRVGVRDLTRAISLQLRALNQWRRRSGLPRLQYCWVVEGHKSGVAHGHAVFVEEPWLAEAGVGGIADPRPDDQEHWVPDAWDATRPTTEDGEEILGRCDLQRANDAARVGSYLAKLAGEAAKGQGIDLLELGLKQRTYGASRGFLAPKRERQSQWTGVMLTAAGAPVRPVAMPKPWAEREALQLDDRREQARALALIESQRRAARLWRRLTVWTGEQIDYVTGEVTRRVLGVAASLDTRSRRPVRALSYTHAPRDTHDSTNTALQQRLRKAQLHSPPESKHKTKASLALGSRQKPVPLGRPAFAPMVC